MPFNKVNEHKPETARTSFKAKKTKAVYGSDAVLMTLHVLKDEEDDEDEDDSSGGGDDDARQNDGSPLGP